MITIDDIIYKIHDVPGISRLPFMSRFIQNEEGEEEEKEEFKLQGKFYVLLVDDQKEDLEAMKNYFEEAGAIVSVAENGVSALWLARKDKFNIILIANTMRQMDGLQVYKNLINSPDNKNRDTAVYLMLRYALKNEYGICEAPDFTFGERGKPSLADEPDVRFNFSHCRNSCACISMRACWRFTRSWAAIWPILRVRCAWRRRTKPRTEP